MNTFRADTYWEKRLRESYDERGVGDIGLALSYNSWLYAVRRRVFRRMTKRLPLVPAGTRVLDVGSGTGVYIDEWQRWGARDVTGCDITEIAVARLALAFPAAKFLSLDIGSGELAGFKVGSFDVVSAFDVLFHIVDDARYEQAISNIASLLAPGGWFVYSDNLAQERSRKLHYVSRHEADILGPLRRNGFQVRERIPMFVLMNDPVRTSSRILRRWFSLVYRVACRGEAAGGLLGRGLYPLELAATRLVRHGPGTEVLLCQRL